MSAPAAPALVAGPVRLRCAGCGAAPAANEPYPFRCPNQGRGDGADHVLERVLDAGAATFPPAGEPNPFVRFRGLLVSYHRALAGGLGDGGFVDLVRHLDAAVARVDGHGFTETPFGRDGALSARLGMTGGGAWVKDETGNVAGSHKARHLFGIALHLEVAERLGLAPAGGAAPRLAIASCGNAALAAAVVARAANRPLDVYIPPDAEAPVVRRLAELGARTVVCEREAGVPGDPCYHAFREAVARGALPFTCQGNENGLTLEGGMTLGLEIAGAVARGEAPPPDRVVLQVGGGALASSTVEALREAVRLGVLPRMPRIHAVQTRGAFPLMRAYGLLAERIAQRLALWRPCQVHPADYFVGRAALIRDHADAPAVLEEIRHAATHRAEFMWPWEEVPHSLAHGILDDETYDWLGVLRGMLETGGYPVVVEEERLAEANRLSREATGIRACPTGTSGLAGLLDLLVFDRVHPDENVAVVFSGVERG